MAQQDNDSKDLAQDEIERQLSLLLLMHFCFSGLFAFLLVYGILNPGPFTTTIEILSGRIGSLPSSALPMTLTALGVLAVFNGGSFYSLKSRKFKMIAIFTAVLNCFTCVGLPLGLTTIISLNKKNVSKLFS